MWYIIVGCFLFSACAGESLYADIVDNARVKRQNHQPQQQQPAPIQSISYRPYNEAPDRIKHLLQLQQAREPLVHLPAQPPPQLQAASAPGVHRTLAPQQAQQVPLAQPQQYNPKVQYGQAPQQPTYKGIQALQSGGQQGPLPLHGQLQQQQPQQFAPQNAYANQNAYTNQYKPQYNQQPGPNDVYRPALAGPPAGLGQYQAQPQRQVPGQYPKGLPPHIQKIIDSQRAYQG